MSQPQTKPELYYLLKRLLRDPIIILMKGDWRTGKTDTSLLVGYLCLKWGLIDKLGSNIFCYNNPRVDFVETTGGLKKWGHQDKTTKLFILDEGLKHLYRRKAMSAMNVDFISEILPEVSKAHMRMILITQTEKIDQDVLDPAFTRAEWKKVSKKIMECRAKDYPFRVFKNLPRSPIRFDQDRLALFFNKDLSKSSSFKDMDTICQVAHLYSKNVPFNEIKDKYGLHPEQVKRMIRKALKWFVEHYDPTNKPVEDETCIQEENAPSKEISPNQA